MSSSVQINNNQLRLAVHDQVVSIEPYQTMVRRKVDNQGHEVLLHGVENFRAYQEGAFIIVTVRDNSKRLYSAKVPLSYIE